MSNIITVNIIYVVKSVLSQGAPLARAYLGFYCKKRLEVSLLLQDGMLIHRKATPPPQHCIRFPWQFATTHLYSWMYKGTAKEHNTISRLDLRPGPLYPESSALNIRPPCLPQIYYNCLVNYPPFDHFQYFVDYHCFLKWQLLILWFDWQVSHELTNYDEAQHTSVNLKPTNYEPLLFAVQSSDT